MNYTTHKLELQTTATTSRKDVKLNSTSNDKTQETLGQEYWLPVKLISSKVLIKSYISNKQFTLVE